MPSYSVGLRKSSSRSSPIRLFISTPRGPRVGATLDGRVLRRSGRGVWSRPGEPEGWAFRQDLLDRALQLGARLVEVIDRERRRRYRAPLSVLLLAPAVDVGEWGIQRVLPLDRWEVVEAASSSQEQMALALGGVAS